MDIVILNIINELYADLIIYIDYILHVKRKKKVWIFCYAQCIKKHCLQKFEVRLQQAYKSRVCKSVGTDHPSRPVQSRPLLSRTLSLDHISWCA